MIIRLARPDDDALLADLLARCSPETLYRRFHGVPSAIVRQQFVAAGEVPTPSAGAVHLVGVGGGVRSGRPPAPVRALTPASIRAPATVPPPVVAVDGRRGETVSRSWVAEADGALRGIATLVFGAGGTAEIAVLVEDDWARRGVGRRMAEELVRDAARAGLTLLEAYIQPDNAPAKAFFRSLAPGARAHFEQRELVVRIPLAPVADVPATGSVPPGRCRPRTTAPPRRRRRRRTGAG